MKQRFSSRELEEDYEAAAAAAARARGFSRLTKFMKVISRGSSSSSTPPSLQYHNSLLMNRGRLPEPPSSSSSFRRRRTEVPNQEELPQQQQPKSSGSNRMYTCKTCGRQFETFQALGGHRASHKMKLVGPAIVGEDGSYQHFQYKAKLHRCSICDKGYQTGQALGGHMRKHRELLENQRLAAAAADDAHHHHQNVINTDAAAAAAAAANHQSNALRWAQMNAAAIFQYSNPPSQRYDNAEAEPEEILREKVPIRKGLNFDLNLDVLENEELGLGTDE